MTTGDVQRELESVRQVTGIELFTHVLRLIAEGAPVPLELLADRAGRSLEYVRTTLRAQRSVEWDDEGRLVGFGLTLRPTQHEFTLRERTLYVWCADDALVFPVILGEPAHVDSACPATGRAIHVDVAPDRVVHVDPADAVVSLVRPDCRMDDVRASLCDHGHFFASRAAATDWLAEHPAGSVRTVEDDFDMSRRVVQELAVEHA